MPTRYQMGVPPPEGWQEFEDIVLSSLVIKWGSPNLVKHGRRGQAQQGVDIHGPDDLGRPVGVQCKNTPEGLEASTLEGEAEKAEAFEPSLSAFYLATTAPTDAVVQREARLLSEERIKQGKFPVGVFFWDDLVTELAKNEEEFSRHYPDLQLGRPPVKTKGARLLSLLDLAYHGRHLEDHFDLIFGETGLLWGETPQRFQAILRLVENCAFVVLKAEDATRYSALARGAWDYIEAALANPAESEWHWRAARAAVQSLEGDAVALEPTLEGEGLAAYSVGATVGGWEWRDPNAPPVARARTSELAERIRLLAPDEQTTGALSELLDTYHRLAEEPWQRMQAEAIPDRVYGLVKSLIRARELGIVGP